MRGYVLREGRQRKYECIESQRGEYPVCITRVIVIRALMMALWSRCPNRGLHHSDHASQYASHDFQDLLEEHVIICSRGSTGDCYDNAAMQRFFALLKREWTH